MATRKPRKTPTPKPKPSGAVKERYHHGDLRQALLDAALRLISEEGFAALTLREVARRAGVTHAAPYRHFADKEELLGAVALEGFRMMTAAMRERMAREERLLERFSASGIAYVLFAVEHPAHFRVMFGPHLTRGLDPEAIAHEDADAFGLLVDTIQECQRAGVLGEGEPRDLALSAWSMVHGLASLLVDRRLGEAAQGRAEALAIAQTRVLVTGLGRAPRG
jgi:AcrR family transcriptional regulator